MGRQTWITFGVLVASVTALAAVPKPKVTPARILHSAGAAMGGTAGGAVSLMDFRRTTSKKSKMERIVLDFGDADLKEAKGLVGYYHAELQENPSRLVLELPQTFASRLPEKEILKRLENSLYVKKAQVGFDRNLQSMTLIFQLKGPVQARVARIDNPESSGKIVIDLLPENPVAKRRYEERLRQAALRARPPSRQVSTVRGSAPAAARPSFIDRPASRPAVTARPAQAATKLPAKTSPALSRAVTNTKPELPKGKPGMTEADRKAAASIQAPGTNR